MRPRSRTTVEAIEFDAPACTTLAAQAAGIALRKRPFGSRPSDRAAAVAAGILLYTVPRGLFPKRAKPLAVRFAFVALRCIILFHLAFILATSSCLVVFKFVEPGATTLMAYRSAVDSWRLQKLRFVPLKQIPRSVRTMTLRVEDEDFYGHHGIVPAAIKRAYYLNKGFGEPIYGGSTITMQTARTIFLIPEKSYVRKYLELIITLEMEAILGKDRILELYFNYAEWGKGVFGIGAAARFHFKRDIAAVGRDQAIRLVTLLSSPITHGPYSFGRNGILWSRYSYLNSRWGEEAAAPPSSASLQEPLPAAAPEQAPAPVDTTNPGAESAVLSDSNPAPDAGKTP